MTEPKYLLSSLMVDLWKTKKCILVLTRKPAHGYGTILIPVYILALLISLVYLVKFSLKDIGHSMVKGL